VLDPFSGSGSTAAAAFQLGRDYVGVEISEKYAGNAERRLAQLKEQRSDSCVFNANELNEVKRLVSDMEIGAAKIAGDEKLLELFTNQFSVRMNNGRKYRSDEIGTALRDSAG
jgi:tRNA G10  N-methylase Trm11